MAFHGNRLGIAMDGGVYFIAVGIRNETSSIKMEVSRGIYLFDSIPDPQGSVGVTLRFFSII